mgnify:CR=1 FL=1
MNLKFFYIIIFTFIFSSANAGYIKGLGANECGVVLSTVKQAEKADIEWVSMMYTAWIQGYMSGLDNDKPTSTSRIKDIHKDSLYLSVINRCKEEPLENLYEATNFIYYNKLK